MNSPPHQSFSSFTNSFIDDAKHKAQNSFFSLSSFIVVGIWKQANFTICFFLVDKIPTFSCLWSWSVRRFVKDMCWVLLKGVHGTFLSKKNLILFISFHSQIEYDPGFMYDVSLQMESEFNGEIKSIVPAEHKKHRHKWVSLYLSHSSNSLHYTWWKHKPCQLQIKLTHLFPSFPSLYLLLMYDSIDTSIMTTSDAKKGRKDENERFSSTTWMTRVSRCEK